MIKYTNISIKEYYNLSEKERQTKSYCVEYFDVTKFWYINGKRHREDGPAAIYSSGRKYWWLYGIEYSFEDWCKILNKTDEEIIFLRLKYHD